MKTTDQYKKSQFINQSTKNAIPAQELKGIHQERLK